MASDINKVVLSGRLTRKPELKTFDNGQVATVGFATNKVKKDSRTGDYSETTSFFDLKIFGKRADSFVKLLDKGSRILITGELNQSKWVKDGENRSRVEIVVDDWFFMDSKKKEEDNTTTEEPVAVGVSENTEDGGENIPF